MGPQVMLLLGQLPGTALPQAMLAPAAFLLEQLQSSLTAAQARARRPAFLNSAASQDSPGKKMLLAAPSCIMARDDGLWPHKVSTDTAVTLSNPFASSVAKPFVVKQGHCMYHHAFAQHRLSNLAIAASLHVLECSSTPWED